MTDASWQILTGGVSDNDAVDALVRLLLEQPAERGRAVDMFAGGGGWHEGALQLGLRSVGLELDDAACATSRAAGHPTVKCDVATIDWQTVARRVRIDGAIGSPPCPTFSSAGKGSGRDDMDLILRWVPRVAAGEPLTELGAAVDDARSALVLEPLRMIVATRPTWVALEQVPPCLPIWQTIALALDGLGYRTWTGILEAERYGVPQTRERAILLARRDGRLCHPPAPTHQRYVPGEPRLTAPQLTLDGEVLPWVSMADALGWGMTARPSVSVAGGGDDRRGAKPLGGGTGSQNAIDRERDAGAWDERDLVGFPRRNDRDDDGEYRERDLRAASEPAFAMSEKVRSWTRFRANAQPNAAERGVDEPAPTITGGHDTANRVWLDRRQGGAPPRSEDEPTHTMSSSGLAKGRDVWTPERPATADAQAPCGCPWDYVDAGGFCACCEAHHDDPDGPYAIQGAPGTHHMSRCPARAAAASWTTDRPATTVAGDPRIFPPGHKINADDIAAGRGGQQRSGAGWTETRPSPSLTTTARSEAGGTVRPGADRETTAAVRVTVEEAAALQSFPPGYPWSGSKSKQYQQIGNAVPPLLALHVLAALLDIDPATAVAVEDAA